MSLTVPLAVRLVTARQDRHVTRDLRDLTFRSVVPGGFASLTMSLDRPLHIQPDDIDYYAAAYVYGPDGGVVWEGRLEDPGRGVSGDGLVWEMAAVGPSAHAEDLTAPVNYVDRPVDRFVRRPGTLAALETNGESVLTESAPGWRLRFPRGTVVAIANHGGITYRLIRDAGQMLARISYAYQMGVTDANLRAKWAATAITTDVVHDIAWTTTPAAASRVVGTDWTLGRDLLSLDVHRQTSGLTVPDDDTWALVTNLVVVALRYNADGTLKLTGYSADTVLASEVAADLLGRLLPQYDGVNASIAATSYGIQALSYPDGATPRQVLEDLMRFEPGFYWAAWESSIRPSATTETVLDTFTRTVANGWGTANSGQIWTTSGGVPADYSTNGSQALHSIGAVNSTRRTILGVSVADGEASIQVKTQAGVFALGARFEAGILLRYLDANNYYAGHLFFNTDGTIFVRLLKRVAGTPTTLATAVVAGLPHLSDAFYTLTFAVDGPRLKVKTWRSDLDEPRGWHVTATDTSLSSSAQLVIESLLATGNTNTLPVVLVYDNLRVRAPARGRHRFEWAQWPTVVRYEADIVDGFDSPGSGAGLYDRVRVRWRNANGESRTITRTQVVRELADAGLAREGFIDLGAEAGSQTNAERAGDSFLAEHKSAPNAGRLTIARPIVDLVGGGMVHPWEIRPGNLIRVRGVLPRVDSLNATDRDGVTVFRIIGVAYRASSASAELELDSYPLTVARALAALKRSGGRR